MHWLRYTTTNACRRGRPHPNLLIALSDVRRRLVPAGSRPPLARPSSEGAGLSSFPSFDVRLRALARGTPVLLRADATARCPGGGCRSRGRSSIFRRASVRDWRRQRHRHHVRVRQHVHHRRWSSQHARRARRVRYRQGTQVTSHLGLMLIFSLFVSVVFAVLTRDDPKEQLTLGARLFGGFIGVGILIG